MKILELDVYIDNEYVDNFKADGVIIATPTGSTAYSLSAGGPIVDPSLNSMIITPICPHKMYARTIIVPPEKTVSVKCRAIVDNDAVVATDSEILGKLSSNEIVSVKIAPKKFRLIRFRGYNFYSALHNKLVKKKTDEGVERMKLSRHTKILDLIEMYSIDTQEELARRLSDSGYNVTQATVSRDIKDLKLVKVLGDNGVYKYVQSGNRENGSAEKNFNSIMITSVTDVEQAMNIVVIKTHSGMAQAAGYVIDSLGIDEIVGCVAGDDTLLCVTKNEKMQHFYQKN